jgi:Mg/Co/Ni transporter MgtE
MTAEPPEEGWSRFAARELFVGLLLGSQGDGRVPAQGWLRWATLGFYVALALVVALLIAAIALS